MSARLCVDSKEDLILHLKLTINQNAADQSAVAVERDRAVLERDEAKSLNAKLSQNLLEMRDHTSQTGLTLTCALRLL